MVANCTSGFFFKYRAGSASNRVLQDGLQKWYVLPSNSEWAAAVSGSTVIPQTGSIAFIVFVSNMMLLA